MGLFQRPPSAETSRHFSHSALSPLVFSSCIARSVAVHWRSRLAVKRAREVSRRASGNLGMLESFVVDVPSTSYYSSPASTNSGGGGGSNAYSGSLGSTSSSYSAAAADSLAFETWNSVDPSSLSPRVDSSATFASLLLLVLLIGLGANRILEGFFTRWARWAVEQRRYSERNQTIEARERLERQFGNQDEGSGGGGRGGQE